VEVSVAYQDPLGLKLATVAFSFSQKVCVTFVIVGGGGVIKETVTTSLVALC